MELLQGRASIRSHLTLVIFFLTLTLSGLGYSTFLTWSLNHQQQQALTHADNLSQLLSQDFARLILMNEVAVAADIHSKLQTFDLLEAMLLYSEQGETLYQYQAEQRSGFVPHSLPEPEARTRTLEQGRLSFYRPLSYTSLELGIAYFEFQIETLPQRLQRDAPAVLAIGLVILILSFALAALVARRFTEPVLRLVDFFELHPTPLETRERPSWPEQNEFGCLYAKVNEMLDRIQQANASQRLAAVAFETPTGMLITDANSRILRVNQAFSQITGYTAEEVLGRTPALLKSGRHPASFYQQLWLSLEESQRWEGEIWNRHKNGQVYPERLTIQAVPDDQGETAFYVGAFVDLSELKAAQAEAEYLELFDPLTGLANRLQLEQQLAKSLVTCQQKQTYLLLLCFNLDHFRMINDSYGHDLGEQLLIKKARSLRLHFDDRVFLARSGSDEFVALLEGERYLSLEEATYTAEEAGRSLLQLLQTVDVIQGKFLRSSASLGIALYSGAEDLAAKELIQQAELALHQAKQLDGKDKISFFDPEAQQLTRDHFELTLALEEAILRDEFELYYQAQFDHQQQLVGAEALIRWQHPQRGCLSPNEFIPLAERSSLILGIGYWVLDRACQQLAAWQQQPTKAHLTLAVNVSAQQFQEAQFVPQLQACFERYSMQPSQLKLELTEAVLLERQQEMITKMRRLIAMGVKIAMDDFGTGYSSLSYLQQLPISQIKIDRSFVERLEDQTKGAAIIKSVVSIGQAFELEVLAEGVETQAQLGLLKELGCYLYQGYYFSRPVPLEAFEALLAQPWPETSN